MKVFSYKNLSIFLSAILVFIIWKSPTLGSFRYPFVLLGTWFHEMGHGITALVLGGNFEYLEIYKNGGGVAYTSYLTTELWLPYNLTRALVAFGGLIGPCIMGSLLIISGTKPNLSKLMLGLLVISIVISLIFWLRSYMPMLILGTIAFILGIIIFINNNSVIHWTVLFLGLQSTLSTYLQLDYLFTSSFIRNGTQNISDTQAIANNLFGTHWMWAIIVIIFSLVLLFKSYKYYLLKNS